MPGAILGPGGRFMRKTFVQRHPTFAFWAAISAVTAITAYPAWNCYNGLVRGAIFRHGRYMTLVDDGAAFGTYLFLNLAWAILGCAFVGFALVVRRRKSKAKHPY